MDREVLAIAVIGGLALGWFTAGILLYSYGDRIAWWWENRRARARDASIGIWCDVTAKPRVTLEEQCPAIMWEVGRCELTAGHDGNHQLRSRQWQQPISTRT